MKGKTAAGGGAICAIAVMITIVMGNGNVRTNQAGLELIGNAEGCRRDPYMCPAGVGQYYDCAGDIVRIKSLDFDSQRADVEIIFTFKGTKSGNWDVKTLDKQVDVTPDEDAVMQKISGGVSIAGINDIISCDDFYRFQQRGMIKITDSYGVQTTESGYSIDFVGTYTDPLKHAVYPDRRDGAEVVNC